MRRRPALPITALGPLMDVLFCSLGIFLVLLMIQLIDRAAPARTLRPDLVVLCRSDGSGTSQAELYGLGYSGRRIGALQWDELWREEIAPRLFGAVRIDLVFSSATLLCHGDISDGIELLQRSAPAGSVAVIVSHHPIAGTSDAEEAMVEVLLAVEDPGER